MLLEKNDKTWYTKMLLENNDKNMLKIDTQKCCWKKMITRMMHKNAAGKKWSINDKNMIKGSLGGETSVLRTFRMSGNELVKERVSKERVRQGKS